MWLDQADLIAALEEHPTVRPAIEKTAERAREVSPELHYNARCSPYRHSRALEHGNDAGTKRIHVAIAHYRAHLQPPSPGLAVNATYLGRFLWRKT